MQTTRPTAPTSLPDLAAAYHTTGTNGSFSDLFHEKPGGETTPTFHGELDGETPGGLVVLVVSADPLDDFSIGFLLGLLVGEGHFGGDGRQPQVTLRMH